MTQEEFDTRAAVFVNKHLCRTDRIASFDISKDPYTSDLKTRERFFENIISSLNGYDLSLALFNEKELSYLFELGMLAGRSCGKCTDWFPRIRYTPAKPIFTPVSYGLLYNWYAATDARNIAADGWHVPSQTEWETMTAYIGATIIPYEFGGNRIQAPNTLGIKLKETGTTYWNTPNTGATNEVGFNVKGAGQRGLTGFSSIKTYTTFWSSNDNYALPMMIYGITLSNASQQLSQWTPGGRDVRKHGMSLRLLKDSTSLTHGQTGTYIGTDGKVYRTICIGAQEWLADNLAEKNYRNGDPILEVTDNAAWAALTTGAMCAYNNDWNNV